MAKKLAASVPRIALTRPEAAALGVGPDFRGANVAPELWLVRRGRRRLIPVSELERRTAENTERLLGGGLRDRVEAPHRWHHIGSAASKVFAMADPDKQKARRSVRTAQGKFEREQGAAQRARRKAFAEAQKEGLTLREIGEEVDLHHTRVLQIIRGE